MAERYDAVIVGAGVSGTATAYHLMKAGMKKVLLLDSGSGVATGPTRDSAAVVRMHYSEPVLVRAAMQSREMFINMKELLGKDGGFRQKGWWLVLPPEMMEAASKNIAMQRSLGLDTGFLPEADFPTRAPWLNTDGIGGMIWEPESGYADPVQTTEAFHHAFTQLGGESRFRAPVRWLIRNGDRIEGVVLDDDTVHAGVVVNAAGPWAKPIAETANLTMELRAVREQDTIWETRPGRPMPECSFSTALEAAYCRALGDGRFILGMGYPKAYFDVDPYNFKRTLDDDMRMTAFERNVKRLPNLEGAKFLHGYAALYDITPDFYPYVGPRAGLSGYADFCGGSGHGFKIAPGLSKSLAQWIVDGKTDAEFAGLSYDRLAAGKLYGGLGGNRG